MKKGVRIINCARGGLVDEAALRDALDSGHVAGAAFDVFVEEPATDQSAVRSSRTSSARRISAPRPREAQENVALQVAEQMSDYLLRGAISNAVNFPSITAEEAPKLKPFIALAEKLGSFAGQLTETGIKQGAAHLRGRGGADEDQGADLGGVAGLLRPDAAGRQRRVRAVVAKERGIVVEETTREAAGDYDSLITVTVTTERQTRTVSGTVFADGRRALAHQGYIRMDAEFGRR